MFTQISVTIWLHWATMSFSKPGFKLFNSLAPGRWCSIFKLITFKLISRTDLLIISYEIALRWITLLKISEHWFRSWLGAVRQQDTTCTNVDLDPCRHLVSLGHNELKLLWPGDTMWCHRSDLKLTRVCHLFGTKPLPEPMLTYCEIWIKIQHSSFNIGSDNGLLPGHTKPLF